MVVVVVMMVVVVVMMMRMRYDHSNQRLIGPGRAQHIAAPLEVLALRGCRQAPAAQKSPVTQLKNVGLLWINVD